MANIQNEVIFPEEFATTLSEILKNYNLEEGSEELFNKLEKGEPLKGDAVIEIIKDVVFGKTQKEVMASLFESRLNIPKQNAQNLARDIQNRILPSTRKATPVEIAALKKEREEMLDIKEEELPETEDKLPYEPIPMYEPPSSEEPLVPPTRAVPPIKKEIPIIKQGFIKPTEIKKPIKTDGYREPIE